MKKSGDRKYQIIFKELLNNIETGVLKAGTKLLSEEKLAEKYNVSRITVRNSLEALEEMGYIVRTRGKGTFVKAKVIEKKIDNIISFTESSLMAGNTPSSKVLELKLIKAPLVTVNYLNLGEDDQVWFVRRIRYVNSLAVLYEESYWVDAVCGEISASDPLHSMLIMLENKGVKPHFLKQEFVAISAPEGIAENLELPAGFPVLRSTLVASTAMEQPMFLAINYYRTDRLAVSLTRTLQ